jgi:serine protease Do
MNQRMMKKLVPILVLISMLFSYAPITEAASIIPVKKVSASQTSVTVSVGMTKQLTVAVSPTSATNKKLTWTTSNKAIATVSAIGKVKGLSVGTVNITAKNNSSGKYVTIQVNVHAALPTPILVKSILLNQSEISLKPSETYAIVARILPVNASNKLITWTTSDSKIATVDATGYVTAISNGDAIITATNQASNTKATIVVHVSKPELTSDQIYEKVNPSVVKIEVFNKRSELLGSGSGIIVRSDGVILTNFHVISDISGPVKARIILDNGTSYYTDTVLGYDADRDLAVLKINEKVNLPSAEILSTMSSVQAGQTVYALGSPNGVQNAMTTGYVRSTEYYYDSSSKLSFISHSSTLYPGNSGGALVNAYGEVIGVNDAVVSQGRQSIYLAIPISDYSKINISSTTTMAEVNRKTYIPLAGEGTVAEMEPNDDLESSTTIPYLKSNIVGTVESRFDYDGYRFNLTEAASLNFTFTMSDSRYNDYVGLILMDEDGNIVTKMSAIGLQASATLAPGSYWLVLAPSNYRSNSMRNIGYTGTVTITPLP